MSDIQAAVPVIVLDTNVCLDLYIFHDPRWLSLKTQLDEAKLRAITSASCRQEWLLVLDYKKFQLTDAIKLAAISAFERHHILWEPAADAADAALPRKIRPALPVCKDKDDQKFLELAADGKASTLITKDKALLRLAGKCRRDGLFAIMTPTQWCAQN